MVGMEKSKMTIFQEYDQQLEPIFDRLANIWGEKNKPYTTLREFFKNSAPTIAMRGNVELSRISDILTLNEKKSVKLGVEKNFRTDDLISYISPLLSDNAVFYDMMLKVYETALQRSAGKGELLVSLLSTDARKAKKHGDINIDGKNVELKSDTGTIHQKEENKWRVNDKLIRDTYNLTASEVKEKYKSYHPLPTILSDGKQAREFYSKVYRNWNDEKLDTIETIWNDTECPDQRSMEIGYLVLLDYIEHKNIDSLLLTRLRDGKISAVHISDFTDKEFIFANVTLKPQKMRGGSTEARPDGLVNIGVKKSTR